MYQRLAQTGTALDTLYTIIYQSDFMCRFLRFVVSISYRTDCLAAAEVVVNNLEDKRSYFHINKRLISILFASLFVDKRDLVL